MGTVSVPVSLLARLFNQAGEVTPKINVMLELAPTDAGQDLAQLTEKQILQLAALFIMLFSRDRKAEQLAAACEIYASVVRSPGRYSAEMERVARDKLAILHDVAAKLRIEVP